MPSAFKQEQLSVLCVTVLSPHGQLSPGRFAKFRLPELINGLAKSSPSIPDRARNEKFPVPVRDLEAENQGTPDGSQLVPRIG